MLGLVIWVVLTFPVLIAIKTGSDIHGLYHPESLAIFSLAYLNASFPLLIGPLFASHYTESQLRNTYRVYCVILVLILAGIQTYQVVANYRNDTMWAITFHLLSFAIIYVLYARLTPEEIRANRKPDPLGIRGKK